MRSTLREKNSEWCIKLGKRLKAAKYDTKKALGQIALEMENNIRETMLTLSNPENAPVTARRKGFNNPLIDTGTLANDFLSSSVIEVRGK
ncbi:MAG: hypothetical protein LBK01_00020 [Burkholderiaceae bacterium]|jgi:hypothetical protein|nr:hypothetical protein [Burkholderiaceae bacterium]